MHYTLQLTVATPHDSSNYYSPQRSHPSNPSRIPQVLILWPLVIHLAIIYPYCSHISSLPPPPSLHLTSLHLTSHHQDNRRVDPPQVHPPSPLITSLHITSLNSTSHLITSLNFTSLHITRATVSSTHCKPIGQGKTLRSTHQVPNHLLSLTSTHTHTHIPSSRLFSTSCSAPSHTIQQTLTHRLAHLHTLSYVYPIPHPITHTLF